MISTLETYAPWFLGLQRIVTALVYMEHGTQKLFHFPAFGPRPGARAAATAAKSVADAAVSVVSSAADTAVSAVSSVAASLDAASSAPPPGGGGPSGAMAGVFLFAGILETFGGLALVLGLLTRPVAFIVAGECAVIFWWMHVPHGGFFPVANGGEGAVLFCFTFLYLVFAGPGAFALDNLIWRRQAMA
jgi:putative oxidoreductase